MTIFHPGVRPDGATVKMLDHNGIIPEPLTRAAPEPNPLATLTGQPTVALLICDPNRGKSYPTICGGPFTA